MAITTRRSILLGAASAGLAAPAVAQGFPSRPVRLVVPYSAGGGADTTARLIAPKLQEALGQTVVIDNKPGAGGTIGDDFVAKSAPDGHTLLIGAFAHAVNPSLMARMPFRTPDDFAPVSLLVTVPELLVVTPSFAAKTVADLVAMAKAEPGKLSYGSSGNGSAQHLAAELFKMRTGTDIQHVPYKGGALAVADVAAGHVPFLLRQHERRPAAGAGGAGEGTGRHQPAAVTGGAGNPDHGRVRRVGVRDLRVERAPGPGRHAAVGDRPSQRRSREDPARRRHQGQVRGPRCADDRLDADGAGGLPAGRTGQVGRGRAGCGDQDRIAPMDGESSFL